MHPNLRKGTVETILTLSSPLTGQLVMFELRVTPCFGRQQSWFTGLGLSFFVPPSGSLLQSRGRT